MQTKKTYTATTKIIFTIKPQKVTKLTPFYKESGPCAPQST